MHQTHVEGNFSVKLEPQSDPHSPTNLGRMLIDKQYFGDLEATGKGQMLTGMTEVKGSAGYVAMERVTGTLQGRLGSFVLLHSGIMAAGKQQLNISVVPDSGSEQLLGLCGQMDIQISEGQHRYHFDYSLPES